MPIQLAQCWFHELAIFNARILIHFSNKIYGSNYIKQHCTRKLLHFEITKMLIAVLKNKFNVSLIIIFSTRYTNRIVSTVVDSVPLRRSSCTIHRRVASPSATALSQSPQLAFGTVCHLFSVVTLSQFLSLG